MPLPGPRELDRTLWMADGRLTIHPVPWWLGQLSVRMTLGRAASGDPLVHSPIRPTETLGSFHGKASSDPRFRVVELPSSQAPALTHPKAVAEALTA